MPDSFFDKLLKDLGVTKDFSDLLHNARFVQSKFSILATYVNFFQDDIGKKRRVEVEVQNINSLRSLIPNS